MVLPASAPPDAPAAPAASWLGRISAVLGLTPNGLLVLADRARPWHLGELVRSLLPTHPDLEVHTDPRAAATVAEGNTFLFVPEAAHADWLNQERPIFARRRLKVVLACDRATSEALARSAPDFFDWISIYTECPESAPPHAIRGFRAALSIRASGVAFLANDAEERARAREVFDRALPGRGLLKLDPRGGFAKMVEAIRGAHRAWPMVTEDHPFLLRRVRWALAEGERRSCAIVVTHGAISLEGPALPLALSGFFPVHGATLSISEARTLLAKAGAMHPGRLAALTGLEPEAVWLCELFLRHGEDEKALVEALLVANDPGAWLAERALDAGLIQAPGLAQGKAMLPLLRARARGRGAFLAQAEDLVLRKRRADPVGQLALHAFDAGDYDAGTHWAARAISEERDERPIVIAVQARYGQALHEERAPQAAYWLLKVKLRAEKELGVGHPLFASATDTLVRELARQGNVDEAAHYLGKALRIIKKEHGVAHPSFAQLIPTLANCLCGSLRLLEAETLLRRATGIEVASIDEVLDTVGRTLPALHAKGALRAWWRTPSAPPGERWPLLRALGEVLLMQAREDEAEPLLRDALAAIEARYGAYHPWLLPLLEDLAQTRTAAERFEEAEALATRAKEIASLCFGQEDTTSIRLLVKPDVGKMFVQPKVEADLDESLKDVMVQEVPRIRRWLQLRGVPPEDAHDILQDTLIWFWNFIEKTDVPLVKARVMLSKIARYRYIDYLKRRRREERAIGALSAEELAERSTSSAPADERDLPHELQTVIFMLPDRSRHLLEMRLSGRSIQEMARILGKSEQTVRTDLWHLREKLRRILEKEASPKRR